MIIPPTSGNPITETAVNARLGFLASDALGGRGSATRDEWITAAYIASEFEAAGLLPAGTTNDGDGNDYIQTIDLGTRQAFTEPVSLELSSENAFMRRQRPVQLTHGENMLVFHIDQPMVAAPLRIVDLSQPQAIDQVQPRDLVLLDGMDKLAQSPNMRAVLLALKEKGAGAVFIPAGATFLANWDQIADSLAPAIENKPPELDIYKTQVLPSHAALSPDAVNALKALGTGTPLTFGGNVGEVETKKTWNVFAKLPGSDADAKAVMLTAHMDHLGTKDNGTDDHIYNGANDDASGVVTVMSLADALANNGEAEKRDVIFGAFGAEEMGLLGSLYYAENPTVDLDQVAFNVSFEMLGNIPVDDQGRALQVTGADRSNLMDMLNANGANLVPDAFPQMQYFMRSDNYPLAMKGVVSHEIANINGIDADEPHYHKPSDDISNANVPALTQAINMLVEPITKMANGDDVPKWNPGGDPSQE